MIFKNLLPVTLNLKSVTLFMFSMLFSVNALAIETTDVRFQLVSSDKTVLSSQIPGKITKLKINTGDSFKKGQVLVAIDCATYYAKRKKVLAELNLERSKLKVQNQLQKLGSGSILEKTLIEAEIQKVKADLNVIDITLQRCQIKAPFSGQVIERSGMPFQYVDVGQPILEIVDNSNLEIMLIVPSNWLSWIKVGQPFSVMIDETQTTHKATISRIGAHVDSASQSVNLVGKLQTSNNKLFSGMSGTASFALPSLENE